MSFVHLHVHSAYSLLDGAGRVEELAAAAKAKGMPALALTDHGVMYGAVPFYKACKRAGIRPIIGLEAYVVNHPLNRPVSRNENKMYHLILLAENLTGYRNLLKISTLAHLEGFYYKPRVDKDVLKKNADGLIALSSCLSGEVANLFLEGKDEAAARAAAEYESIYGRGNFYLELQDHGLREQKQVNQKIVELSRATGIPLVASNDVHYVKKEDADVHDVLLCIGTGRKVGEKERLKFPSDQYYLKSPDEMASLFGFVPEALQNTVRIAERCDLEIPMGESILPAFPVPEGKDADAYLRQLCEKGMRERYPNGSEEARKRLEEELAVISRMGYSDYFLIVWDFIRFARERGSAWGREGAPQREVWLRTCSGSRMWTRSGISFCSSGFSIPSGSPCRILMSTSPIIAAMK